MTGRVIALSATVGGGSLFAENELRATTHPVTCKVPAYRYICRKAVRQERDEDSMGKVELAQWRFEVGLIVCSRMFSTCFETVLLDQTYRNKNKPWILSKSIGVMFIYTTKLR